MHTLQLLLQQGGSQPQGSGSMGFLIMMVAIFVIMWLFMIRPQQKKQKQIRQFQNSIEAGTKVVTGGGIYGTVKHVDTNGKVEVEIARGVTIEVDRSYVFADVSALQTNQPQQK